MSGINTILLFCSILFHSISLLSSLIPTRFSVRSHIKTSMSAVHLLISLYDPDSWWQHRLKIHFPIWSLPPLIPSVSFFPLCGEGQIERARLQFKGQSQVSASRAFTSATTEALLNYQEMLYQSRHIMQPAESCIKLSLTPSLLRFYCPARLLTNLQLWLHWRF